MNFRTLESEMFYKNSSDNVKMKHFNHRISSLRNNFYKAYVKPVIDSKVKFSNKNSQRCLSRLRK